MGAVTTNDGSSTLFNQQFGEHYHSIHGAVQESEHVFIQHALARCNKPLIKLWEIALGTGLNMLLAARYAAQKGIHIDAHSIEAFPITKEQAEALNYGSLFPEAQAYLDGIHQDQWGSPIQLNDNCQLTKYHMPLEDWRGQADVDVVFYDAFSPTVQEELWADWCFESMYNTMAPGGVLSTYCARGFVRRNMIAAGFEVEKVPGPPGKREMLRAVKP